MHAFPPQFRCTDARTLQQYDVRRSMFDSKVDGSQPNGGKPSSCFNVNQCAAKAAQVLAARNGPPPPAPKYAIVLSHTLERPGRARLVGVRVFLCRRPCVFCRCLGVRVSVYLCVLVKLPAWLPPLLRYCRLMCCCADNIA